MKLILILLAAVLHVNAVPQLWGQIGIFKKERNCYTRARANQVVEQTFRFPEESAFSRLRMLSPVRIVGIEQIERADIPSRVTILDGGVGYTFAKIKIQSAPGEQINSLFYFHYGVEIGSTGENRTHINQATARQTASSSSTAIRVQNEGDGLSDGEDEEEEHAENTEPISCPICAESLNGRKAYTTPCGHVFCKNCLRLALNQQNRCPTCRQPLTAQVCRRLFLG